jgi:hypothetical protein
MHEVQFCILKPSFWRIFSTRRRKKIVWQTKIGKKNFVDVADGGSNAISDGTKRANLANVM